MKPTDWPPQAPKSSSAFIRHWLGWSVSLILWAALIWVLISRQAILDWWTLRHYQPSHAVASFVGQDGLTTNGQRLLYLGRAEVDSKSNFNTHCRHGELRQSLVLGCFTANHIYILQVDHSQLKSVMAVTAAHEMLHNAYARLNATEKTRVNGWIESFYHHQHDPAIQQLVKLYNRSEPGELLNELHSILPTEVVHLSPELENYYSRYFSDRSKVVSAFTAYQSVFTNLDHKRSALLDQLSDLKSQIDSLKTQYDAAASQASQLTAQINALRRQGKVAESNRLVPAQNAAAARANALADQIKTNITVYNSLVDRVNQLALVQNDLVASLDSADFTK